MASELFVDKITGKTGTAGSAPLSMSGNTLTATLGTSSTGFGLTTHVDQWRVESNTTTEGILTNVGQVGTDSFSQIGTAMTESSGYFTFPTTGKWLITAFASYKSTSGGITYAAIYNYFTTDNSNYNLRTFGATSISGTNYYGVSYCNYMFDVSNTTTHKMYFYYARPSANVTLLGSTSQNNSTFTFIRLGDT